MWIKIILSVFLSVAIYGLVIEGALCPGLGTAPTPRHFLNLERLSGHWKMLKAGPRSASSNRTVDCNTYTFSKSTESIHFYDALYRERVNGSVINEIKELVTVKQFPIPSHWDMWGPEYYMPTDVVATDYDNYMILYMCNDLEGLQNGEPVWLIFGREQTMPPLMLDTLLWFIEGFGFSRDEFININQFSCT